MIPLKSAALILIVLTSPVVFAAEGPSKTTVALTATVEDSTVDADVELSKSLLALMEAEAIQRSGIAVVERQQIDLVLYELMLSQAQANDAARTLQLGKLATADLIVSVKLNEALADDRRTASVRITEPLTGVIRGATVVQMNAVDVEEAAEQIIHYVNAVIRSPKTAGLSVSVGTFESEGKFDHVRPLELIVRDVITEQLRRHGGFQVLQRTDMSSLLSELELVASGLADRENLPDTLPARASLYHIHGTVNERIDAENNIHMIVNAKLTQAFTGKVVMSVKKEFVKEDTTKTLRELTSHFIESLELSKSVTSAADAPTFDEAKELHDLAIRDVRRFNRSTIGFGTYYVGMVKSPLPMRPGVAGGSDLGHHLLRKSIDRLETVLFLQPENRSAQFALGYCYSFHVPGVWNPTRSDQLFRQIINAEQESPLAVASFRHLMAIYRHHRGGRRIVAEHVPLFIERVNFILSNAPYGTVSTIAEFRWVTDLHLARKDFAGLLETTTLGWKRCERNDPLHRSHKFDAGAVAAALEQILTHSESPVDVRKKAQQLLDQWAQHPDEHFRKSAFENLPSLLLTDEQVEANHQAYAARIMARQRPLEYVSPELLATASYFLNSERPLQTVALLNQVNAAKVWPENGVVHMSRWARDYYRTLGKAYEASNQPDKARDAYLSSSELKKSARIDPTTEQKIIELGGVPLKSERDISVRHHDFPVAGQHAEQLATDGERLFCGKLGYRGVSGIWVLDLRTKTWSDFKNVPHHVTCLAVREGTLWAGTKENGLWKVNVASRMTTQFTKANGLPADRVVAFAVAGDDTYARVLTSGVSAGGIVHINKHGAVRYLGDAKPRSAETNISATGMMVANQKLLITLKSRVYQWDEQNGSWTDFFDRIVPGKLFYDNGTFWNAQSSRKLHLEELKPDGRIYTTNHDLGSL